jgi:hypothetical protein
MSDNQGALSVSARLRAAREERGYSLDDIATKTRVPIRHLKHIDAGDWDQLPAITYTIGFARSYAGAVGLNGTEIGAELRQHLGQGGDKRGGAPLYEPADPARVPPRSLAIIAGLLALALAIGYLVWRTNAAKEPDMLEVATQPEPEAPPQPQAQPPAAPVPAAVVLEATSDLWLRVDEPGGAKLREGVMKAGERWEVPPTVQQPQITTGRPDALRITVGATEIPPLGEPRRTIAGVSLLPNDLLARVQGAAPAAGAATAAVQAAPPRPAAAPRPVPRQATPRPAAPQAAAPEPAAPPPAAPPASEPAAAEPPTE